VLLTGLPSSPRVADSRRIDLSDPAIPESRQPYHAGFATARASGPELSHLVGSVRRYGRESVTSLFREYHTAGHRLVGVGVIVGSLIDPETVANEHIRIHAREGQLFRGVVEEAVRVSALSLSVWRERDLYSAAAAALRWPAEQVRERVTALRTPTSGPWRAEQKAATVAAWLVLSDQQSAISNQQ
jgi:hypothetical protein